MVDGRQPGCQSLRFHEKQVGTHVYADTRACICTCVEAEVDIKYIKAGSLQLKHTNLVSTASQFALSVHSTTAWHLCGY